MRFLIWLGLLTGPCIVIYATILPSYTRFILAASDMILAVFPGSTRVWSSTNGQWGLLNNEIPGPIVLGGAKYSAGVFLSLATLVALLLGTLLTGGARFRVAFLAIVLMVSLHIASVVMLIIVSPHILNTELFYNLKGSLVYANHIMGPSIWAVLCWRSFFDLHTAMT
jgi:hypothetical protein